jgi:serine/threonine protein kinase
MSLRALFEQHGLMEHLPAFERERVAVRDLPELTEQELSESFGVVSFGDRKRFRALVASLSSASSSTPTPTPSPAPPPAGATRVDAPLSAASAPPSPTAGATRVDGAFSASSSSSPSPSSTAGATRVDAAGGLPARIGSYRILGLVGSGGMGTVVRARHAEDGWAAQQGGDVAIKLIHPEIASSAEFRSRFMTEAGLGRRLQHPGLVPVYDVVSDGPWLGTVMGLVLGAPLSQRIVPGGLSVGEVAALLEPLGAALDHLHSHGVVHRDVKPANIVVRADGSAVLLDLGIAKDTQAELGGHTRTMTALGTSAWMAPEQADAKHVDGAADRYAFGLLAYALLAGRMPWGSDATEARVLATKLMGQLEPLSVSKPGVSGSVSTAVMSMLSLSPSERPSSCASFMAKLTEQGSSSLSALPSPPPFSGAGGVVPPARPPAPGPMELSGMGAPPAGSPSPPAAPSVHRASPSGPLPGALNRPSSAADEGENTPMPTTSNAWSKVRLGCLALIALPICWVSLWVWTATSQRGHYEVLCSIPRESVPGEDSTLSEVTVSFDVSRGSADVGLAIDGLPFLNDVYVSGLQVDIDGETVQSAKVVDDMSDMAPHYWCCSRFEVPTTSGTFWLKIDPVDGDNDQVVCKVLDGPERDHGPAFEGRFLQRP